MFINESILTDVVQAMLPTFSGKLALRMVLDLSLDHYSENDEEEIHARHFVEFTFHRPTNYTKVYVRHAQHSNEFPDTYERSSDHDSCWRSDGLRKLTELYFSMRKPFEECGLKFHQIHEHVSFGLNLPHYLTIEGREAIDKENSYPKFFKLDVGPEVPLSKIHEFFTKDSGRGG